MLQGIQKADYSLSTYKTNLPRMVPIAPAEKPFLSMDMDTEKKKYNYKSNPYTGAQSVSIARRNARERNRVKQVNDGFNALRKRLPASVIAALSGGARRGSGKKLSKVDTLRMVVEYIRYLQTMIEDSDASLGITHMKPTQEQSPCEVDEGIFGASSPYSDSLPSPVSDCSSGVSSTYSNRYVPNYQTSENQITLEEDELLDAISWWQEK